MGNLTTKTKQGVLSFIIFSIFSLKCILIDIDMIRSDCIIFVRYL